MSRTIVAVVPWMDADLRESICRRAEENGFEAAFFGPLKFSPARGFFVFYFCDFLSFYA